jgi:hypothetical protein
MLDNDMGRAVYWLHDASEHPTYMSGSPLLTILHWWMSSHGRQFVHAGAVGTTEGGVLLAGKGGSGKSTTALACLNEELLYLGDDYCLINTTSPYRAYSLYNTGKVDAISLKMLPHLSTFITNTHCDFAGKLLLFVNQLQPKRIIRSFPVRAILVPQITGKKDSELRLASKAHTLQALASSTLFQLSGAGHEAFQSLVRVVRHLPCYNLDLGTDLSGISNLILGLLSDL